MRSPPHARVMLALLSCACVPRVALPPLPPAAAPREQREAALERLQPVDPPTPVTSKHNGVTFTGRDVPFLRLGGGEEVWDPRDLAAVLPEGTATGANAARYDEAHYRSRVMYLAGAGSMLAALGFIGTVLAMGSPRLDARGGGLLIGGSAALLAGWISIAAGIMTWIIGTSSARADAFATWPADLRAALGLSLPAP